MLKYLEVTDIVVTDQTNLNI